MTQRQVLRTPPDSRSLVRIRDVRKTYGELEVLRGIDLDVRAGETLCIIGASGSGKSTLLRTVNGLVPLTAGTIAVGNERVGYERRGDHLVPWGSKAAARFRSRIGLVSQSVNLFPNRTALENVAEGPIHVLGRPRREAHEEALASLEIVGLAGKAARYPSELSGGEQQRVAIARALVMKPRLLLFDEATSALDPALVGEVLVVMRRLADEGTTMIVVTHEMQFARDASHRVAVMDAGLIVDEGPTPQLFDELAHDRTRALLRPRAA